jgi:hypothetical protein
MAQFLIKQGKIFENRKLVIGFKQCYIFYLKKITANILSSGSEDGKIVGNDHDQEVCKIQTEGMKISVRK